MKRKISLGAMVLLYIGAGVNHFINPDFYISVMPYYIPFHKEMVLLSGILEVILGLLLLFEKTRFLASWCIVFMLIAFLPVHIQMIIDHTDPSTLIFWISWIRIPLQWILMRWAYKMRKVRINNIK